VVATAACAGVVATGCTVVVAGTAGVVCGTGVLSGALPPVQPAARMARTRNPARRRGVTGFFKGCFTAQELGGEDI
jgi:hypothetical protein